MKMMQEIFDQKDIFEKLHVYLDTKKESLKQKVTQIETIYLFGTGASLNACYAALFAFVKHAKIKPVIIPAAEAEYYVDLINENDLVFVISQSGDSFETKVVCDIFVSRNIQFIGITNNEQSTLANKATDTLLLHAGNEISSATKTYTATIYVLLYVAMVNENSEALLEIDPKINEILDTPYDTKYIVEEIAKSDRMYVLSDPINYSTARATALLFKEKDLILAEAMTLSEFRHGAVEVVKEGFLCFIIVSDLSYKHEFLKHFRFLQSIGATIICLSSYDIENLSIKHHIKLARLQHNVFNPLTMIIPSQIISVEVANELGLNVDEFIYLNKVVDKY